MKWILGPGNCIDATLVENFMANLKSSGRSAKLRSPLAKAKKRRRVSGKSGALKLKFTSGVGRVSAFTKSIKMPDGTYLHARFNPLAGAYDIIDRTPGPVRVETAASQLGVSSAQLLETAGVKSDVKSSLTLAKLDKNARTRVREMLEIVSRISAWAGGKEQAFAWYRAEPIPAFGSRTAESLVKEGKAAAVRDYLDHVATGGFA
jgi:Protein of unknown function (DUF2384)